MTEGLEETLGGQCCELLKSLGNHHFLVTDADVAEEHIETIHDDGGIEVDELRDRGEVSQGRKVNRFVEGCL